MERGHTKRVLKTMFHFNYFTLYCSTDTQGGWEFIQNFSFTCRQFDVVQRSIDCMCITYKLFVVLTE